MKQVLQRAYSGEVEVADVPAPQLLAGCVLVRIAASLVSAGTERASTEFAGKNLLQKAAARPDLVREVIGKVRRDGIVSAVASVRSRLHEPTSLGYSSAGTVVAVGEGVTDILAGDRVACAGAGYAVHAEFACVPRLLVAKLPADSIPFEEAAFTTLGAVALHGVRTADAKLGDIVAVIGLGLLGQLTVQILKAAGCVAVGIDPRPERAELALRLGARAATTSAADFPDLCLQQSRGQGVDAVLITAETPSSDPVNLAAEVARERGVVVAVGTVGMEIQRKLFYQKELDFRVSRAYGPGRYDSSYEQKGRDYPIGYVRWTENRNMEAFLQLLSERKLDVRSLITHRFPIEHAPAAYGLIADRTHASSLAVVITYSGRAEESRQLQLVERRTSVHRDGKDLTIGLLGPGAFAGSMLLPAIKRISGVRLAGVCAATGASARHAAEKFGFRYCATDQQAILHDQDVNTVVIATRHHLHASQILAALESGKNVFCEKPLCLTEDELAQIADFYQPISSRQLLMVGFNRRFAPMVLQMKRFLGEMHEPLAMHYRVNAGSLPSDHWVHDPEQGGGRILGEVCHFVDLLSFLADAPVVEVQTRAITAPGQNSSDNVLISLQFANGSQATVSYLANGDRAYSKERLEIFGGGCVATLDDFRRLELVRHGHKQVFRARFHQDKGHLAEWQAFAAAVRDGVDAPIAFGEIVATTLTTFAVAESCRSGQPVAVDATAFMLNRRKLLSRC